MKVFAFTCLASLSLLAPMRANASAASVRTAYQGCLKYLAMSPAKQAAVSAKSGISVALTLHSCRLLVHEGLERDLALEAKYQRAQNSTSARQDLNTVTCFADDECHTVFSRGLAASSCPSGRSFVYDYDSSSCHAN